ncbi:MAG: UPF0280 family protein [Spirochaetaceae bacterium]|jgi:ApbE superfamily uncharacterized protein (UPF0280 family)|nr:UPF0280 family protein [Spirochaetaceae bacterium]
MKKRISREFHYKEAHFHIVTDQWDSVINRIIEERLNLESFIKKHETFKTSFIPLFFPPGDNTQPESVKRMIKASLKTGLGPMAAVAGTMAQLAFETSRDEGSFETIVENGGDLFLDCKETVIIGLYTGTNQNFKNLALNITPDFMPLAVCTSSGRMGHSLSFGDCDLVSVFSKDASLADAAATLGCNSVHCESDIESVLNILAAIDGVLGAIIIRDDRFGAVGNIPELLKSLDPQMKRKVSRDDLSNF